MDAPLSSWSDELLYLDDNFRHTRFVFGHSLGKAACLFLTVLCAGCSHEEAEFPSQEELYAEPFLPNDYVLTSSSGHVVNARVSPEGLIGPTINLSLVREDNEPMLRGLMFGAAVNAALSPALVSGLWGPNPLRLSVERMERRLHVEGIVRAQIVDLWIDPDAISGTIGTTGYDLHRKAMRYEGSRNAGKAMELVSVQIPESLASFGDSAFAALVVMLLSA